MLTHFFCFERSIAKKNSTNTFKVIFGSIFHTNQQTRQDLKKKELCKIYLKAKDENDQINDIFLKTLEDNVLMTD